MLIPSEKTAQANFLQWVVDNCTSSQSKRREMYDKRRRYFLFGQNSNSIVRFNRLKSHLPLLASFLYASDQIAYAVAAPKNADDQVIAQYLAIEDDWNQSFQDYGLADLVDQALLWSLVYDTMIIKQGWNDVTDTEFGQLVEPSAFGVMREDNWDFTAQQAMVHSYILDYDDAVERLVRAGKASEIERLSSIGGSDADLGLPGMLNQMIISATGGANLAGNIAGSVNPSYEPGPTYRPDFDQSVVRFHEVHVWDTKYADWRVFHLASPDIILSDSLETIGALRRMAEGGKKSERKYDSETNLFLKGETPFTPITPYPLYNYFWGDCHLEDLIPLQTWSTERLDQISEILERQVDPSKVFSGFMGIDDERAEALGGPGTWMSDSMPGAKVDVLEPNMPEDLFREFEEIGSMFMEQSGFTEIMAGRGEKNVRGQGHAREMKTTGGGRVRKVAAGLERPLVRLGDIGLRLKAKNDDEAIKPEGQPEFVLAQVLDEHKYTMRVAGHSHSPLFTAETKDLAFNLLKSGAIDQEWLIRMLRPPNEANLLHALRKRNIARAKAIQANPQLAQPQRGAKPHAVK